VLGGGEDRSLVNKDRDDDGVGAEEMSEALEVARADAGSGSCGGQWEAIVDQRDV
jgi:hypothetical protein